MISDAEDICPVTPSGEQVDAQGCSDSQKDEDNDDISNDKDLCPDTPAAFSVDIDGCAEQQKDDDGDGIKNHVDDCPNTPEGELIDAVGCALVQLDSDGDGVNDAEDAFKFDANESVDSDNDGVADRWDAFPEDPARSQAEVEEAGNGMLYGVIALLMVGLLGGGGYFYNRKQDVATSPFADAMDQMDAATEQNMGGADKALPSLEGAEPQQWEENGVHWSRDATGQLSYYDAGSGEWMPYNG